MNVMAVLFAILMAAPNKNPHNIHNIRKYFMMSDFWFGSVTGKVKGYASPQGDKTYDFALKFNKKGTYELQVVKFSEGRFTVMDSRTVDVKAGERITYRWGIPGSQMKNLLGEKPAVVLFVVKMGHERVAEHLLLVWNGVKKAGASANKTNVKVIGN